MKGKVFLIIGDPGTGKSGLRTKLYDIPFFNEDGIIVQDISPDGEGSWIVKKTKEEVRLKRERYKEYTKEYYEGAKKTIIYSKDYLRLFIADMGGKPNPNLEGISDKEELLKNADGYIVLKNKTSEWEPYLKDGKIRLEYLMPEKKVLKKYFDDYLNNIAKDLKIKLENSLENRIEYIKRIKTLIKKEGYTPIDLSDYNTEESISQTILDKINPLPENDKYCIYGRGPIALSAKLLKNVKSCAVFDPKLEKSIVKIPLNNTIVCGSNLKCEINQDKIYVKTPRFIKVSDVPVIDDDLLLDKMYLSCGGPVWMQLDLFLQLKEKVRKRGVYNKREDIIFWID